MQDSRVQRAAEHTTRNRHRRVWKRAVGVLSCLVVFVTTYALILPAITMEREPLCGQEEHGHTDACYALERLEAGAVLDCPFEPHRHDSACFDAVGELICGQADFVIHTHDKACYDEGGDLICTLPEVEAHEHTEDCYTENRTLICDVEEEPGHKHTAACRRSVRGELTCGIPEGEHDHVDTCYEWVEELICPLEEREPGHIHDESCCYEITRELTCREEELLPHVHGEDCFDTSGDLICGQLEIMEHQHTEDCLSAPEGEAQEVSVLVCGMEEHTHTDECYPDAEPSPAPVLDAAAQPTVTEEAQPVPSEAPPAENASDTEVIPADREEELEEMLLQEVPEDREPGEDGCEEPVDPAAVAEAAKGTNWIALRDSGWFDEYDECGISSYSLDTYSGKVRTAQTRDFSASSVQIDDPGGESSADDVTVSKTIAGTDIENVFDITLTVETPQKINEIISEPDMAVVIVMDISNTMNDNFGGVTRYAAAMEAAEGFLDQFAESNSLGVSKVGYVAFNSDAHQIFDLTKCTSESDANELKNTMRNATGNIINNYQKNSDGNVIDPKRFTNIEAGLKMASDMLEGVSNKNKFIIFLSDGFPTTYISSEYIGCDTYDGRIFYDHVLDIKCNGTSYSDTAAIRAREMATSVKEKGITVFSIGVDVAGQTIDKYHNDSVGYKENYSFSVVERTDTNYEIGDASSTESYKNWLKNSIGSGYYYDSTNTAGLKDAYTQIFNEIKQTVATVTDADWVATDPIPGVSSTPPGEIELIGLYDKNGVLGKETLTGSHEANGENTAEYEITASTISWDLKESGYSTSTADDVTWYRYELTYRVRLKNEDTGFAEKGIYNTNNTTTLQYRVVQMVGGTVTISDAKTMKFPIPLVHGYVGELNFTKVDSLGQTLAGAEFTLTHDPRCSVCRGDETAVLIESITVVSGEDGQVTFSNIPSGHTYILAETKVPDGYARDGNSYTVTVSYDVVTVSVTDPSGASIDWTETIMNNTYYELPATGGTGTLWYTLGGAALMFGAVILLLYKADLRRKGGRGSPC